ncbi:hypothetical protein RR46_15022 [Papilio xuthus]|uniref:Uncharacterized protein n=1 Tax=Papilio xuthus TaxID=66420 RepID=A0A194PES0_PAPXU|nr:hypothetical protein RR46_15022 [Papilio xuthus]
MSLIKRNLVKSKKIDISNNSRAKQRCDDKGRRRSSTLNTAAAFPCAASLTPRLTLPLPCSGSAVARSFPDFSMLQLNLNLIEYTN